MEDLKVVSILVKDRCGVLTRVSNVFARRGVNIKQLTVSETTTEYVARITILTDGNGVDIAQLQKQLKKIEDVQDAIILDYEQTISSEILLVRVQYTQEDLEQIQEMIIDYNGRIVTFNTETVVGRIVGSTTKIDEFIHKIRAFQIIEMSRSGITSLDKSGTIFHI